MKNDIIIKYSFEFNNLMFDFSRNHQLPVCVLLGLFKGVQFQSNFRITIIEEGQGEWRLLDFSSQFPIPGVLNITDQVYKPVLNKAARILDTINTWPSDQGDSGGARIVVNEKKVPDSEIHKVYASFRSRVLYLRINDWQNIWPRILKRVKYDSFFRIQGFSQSNVLKAIRILRKYYKSEWIRSNVRKAISKKGEVGFNSDIPQDYPFWFPVYHFIRTASGAICIDPGWNYLIELGNAIDVLNDFPRFSEIVKEITRKPGIIHQICLTAAIFRKGYLKEIEPSTGSGNATNDISFEINKRIYDIEVKALTSAKPWKVVRKEILDKFKKIPKHPPNPIFFYILIIEEEGFKKEREDQFYSEIETNLSNSIPDNIGGIIAGKMFIDNSGGFPKRDIGYVLINDASLKDYAEMDLREVLTSNHEILYPIFSPNSFFHFSNKM